MIRAIILDSGPLALLLHRPGQKDGDACKAWLSVWTSRKTRIVVPEIIDYELRRELIRSGIAGLAAKLDAFNSVMPDRFLPLTTANMRHAAELWAQARNQGVATADRHALDADVILAAPAIGLGLPPSEYVVASGNVKHLGRFVPAQKWENI